MRVTLKIASAGSHWSFSLPKVDLARCYPKDEDGEERFDEAEFRRQVKDHKAVQFSSEDRGPVCAFAAMLLSSLGEWLGENGMDKSVERDKAVKSISRRSRRDAFMFVRVDLRNGIVEHEGKLKRTVAVDIQYSDNGVVASDRYDHKCALLVAEFCSTFSKRFVENGDPPLVMKKTIAMNDLISELRACKRKRETEEANKSRLWCERHKLGFCSPIKPACPHYCKGKCIDIKETKP